MWKLLPYVPLWDHISSFKERVAFLKNFRTFPDVELFGICAWKLFSARNDLCFDIILVSLEVCFNR